MASFYVTSSHGVHACTWAGTTKHLGLDGDLVSQAVVKGDTMLAAVPVIHEVHAMMHYVDDPAKNQASAAGLYKLDLSGSRSPRAIEEMVCKGNVKSCAIGNESSSGKKRWYAGTEPADVLVSDDEGLTWSDTNSFSAIEGPSMVSRKNWTFPAPPHAPHTLSIDFAPDMNATDKNAEDLVIAGIEVGGCLVLNNDQTWESRFGKLEAASVARIGGQTLDSLPDALKLLTHTDTPRPQLCIDVHQVRPDPFNPSRWFATCGATPQVAGEGGLFVTEDQGRSWERIFDGGPGKQQSKTIGKGLGYAIGLALNPFRKGEILVGAGDQPPGIGSHVHHSLDGGKTFTEITTQVYGHKLQDSKGMHTPVPYFMKEGALLGSDTGDILTCRNVSEGGWEKVCNVPGYITTITAQNRSPSSVMH